MKFRTPREFGRHMANLQRRRTAELVSLGVPVAVARRRARNELSIYDLLVVDEQGRIGVEGLLEDEEGPDNTST